MRTRTSRRDSGCSRPSAAGGGDDDGADVEDDDADDATSGSDDEVVALHAERCEVATEAPTMAEVARSPLLLLVAHWAIRRHLLIFATTTAAKTRRPSCRSDMALWRE